MLHSPLIFSGLALAVLGGATGCEMQLGNGGKKEIGFDPEYISVETRLLDDDLVNFLVVMKGARTKGDVADYAKCAAAQYALIRGFGFARHVRTKVEESDGVWRGDAVYTVSAALPQGVLTLDAEVVVENCKNDGIPTV